MAIDKGKNKDKNIDNSAASGQDSAAKPKKKKGGVVNIILDLIIVALLCVAGYSGYQIVSQLITDKEGDDAYGGIASVAQVEETVVVTLPVPAATQAAGEGEGGEGAEPVPETAEAIVVKQFDWASLMQQNADCVGWLECEDTVISYPVVQGKNNKYYLTHLFDGTEQRYGSLFVDAENTPGFADQNTIIYGHHLKNGKMFGTLRNYKDGNKYYQQHPIFMLYTPEHAYRVELFANALVDGAKGIPMSFASREDYQAWIDKMYKLSTFDSDVVMTPDDKMVTLYTCSYDYDTQRQLLVGKLVQLT